MREDVADVVCIPVLEHVIADKLVLITQRNSSLALRGQPCLRQKGGGNRQEGAKQPGRHGGEVTRPIHRKASLSSPLWRPNSRSRFQLVVHGAINRRQVAVGRVRRRQDAVKPLLRLGSLSL